MRRPLSRRDFHRLAAATAALSLLPAGRLAAQVRFGSNPFQLGVASGDPAADGFVIWTRIAPEPLAPQRLGLVVFEVDWEVAEDAGFSRVAARGTALARPHFAHAVHVEVGGLQPGQEYFYRFRLGRYESPVGRALTLPAAGSTTPLRFALASCAHYEHGYFSAYRYMAEDRPDLAITVGDYIYEDAYGERRARLFDRLEAITLDDYRNRYAQYRTDTDLQAAHAACPWLAVWDDHEVDNDYAGLTSEHEHCGGARVRESFPARRAAAYQAWFEHMPVRLSRMLPGMAARIYGTVDWGTLARFYLLDTRQWRSPQACPQPATPLRCDTDRGQKILFSGAGGGSFADPADPDCRARLNDPARTMLGMEQESWLDEALAAGRRAQWNLLTQSVMFTTIAEGTRESPRVFTDAWAGYPQARERLLASLQRHRTANPVVLTGDIHSFFVNEIAGSGGRPLGVEFVTSSISTNTIDKSALLPLNPHVRYHEGRHCGYLRFTVDAARLLAEAVVVDNIRDPRTPRRVAASFELRPGEPGVRRL